MSSVLTGVAASFDPAVAFTLTQPSDGDGLNVASIEDSATTPKTGLKPLADAIEYLRENVSPFAVFGDGAAGAGAADGSTALAGCSRSGSVYTATGDICFTDLVISTGVEIKMQGFRLYGTGLLTMSGTAKITCSGTNASGVTPGQGGGHNGILGAVAGCDGSAPDGGGGSGVPVNLSAMIGKIGGVGGVGNTGAQTGGVITAATLASVPTAGSIHLSQSRLTGFVFGVGGMGIVQGGSGGSAGGGDGGGGGAGGAGGGGGGVLLIAFRAIALANTAALEVKGGNGSNGGLAGAGTGGGGGGGAGAIIFTYHYLSSGSTPDAITNFTGGSAGSGFAPGVNGNAGSSGSNANQLYLQRV